MHFDMLEKHSFFSPMRKVRMYLKKIRYFSDISRENTYLIFRDNTLYYLEGKITRNFYVSLIETLHFQGDENLIWQSSVDPMLIILNIAARLKNAKTQTDPQDYIFRINKHLLDFLQKRKQRLSEQDILCIQRISNNLIAWIRLNYEINLF